MLIFCGNMAGTSVIKVLPPQDLLTELRTFVAGATRAVKTNPLELARTALSLLKTLPAARDAVLEYFCTLFDSSVSKYVAQIENNVNSGIGSNHEEATIAEIHSVLCTFVSNNPEAWAPIISTWSLELLGELSSRYAGRAHVPLTAGLNESLQLWMSCRATRTLIDITTQCLSCLMHSNTETCINALLNTSVAHSPHFDWVVAHVGSCFPQTVITRVLSCGLKDFCQHGSVEQGAKSPKVLSVVGILGHLAASHFMSIRLALLDLFKWSLEPSCSADEAQKHATVPFLLQLGSLSNTLLCALTADVLQTLNVEMLSQLAELAPRWCIYFGGRQALEDLLVHLARSCEDGGTQILQLLLDASSPLNKSSCQPTVARASRKILELLLQELDLMLRSSGPGSCSVPLLNSMRQDVTVIQPLLLSGDPLRVHTAVRLTGLLGQHSPALLVNSIAYLLQRATRDEHLAAAMRLVTDAVCASSTPVAAVEQERRDNYKYNCLAQALEQAIRSTTKNNDIVAHENGHMSPEQLWLNIAKMLKWEVSCQPRNVDVQIVSRAVCACLREASELLRSPPTPPVAHAVASTLDLVDILYHNQQHKSFEPKMQQMLRLTKAVVSYFFLCLSEKDWLLRIQGIQVCCRLLRRLAVHSPAVRVLALRELLEGALFHSPAYLFGAKPAASKYSSPEVNLLQENHKQSTSIMFAQRYSSVFHAGIIGDGPHKPSSRSILPEDTVSNNVNLLIEVVKACCTNPALDDQAAPNAPLISIDAVTTVSLLLVELLSPDVMYNGLPWPEEEFSKVTIERDLSIRQRFDNLPLTWALLSFVASHRPALCYCSVLLRALAVTLMAQWAARRSAGPTEELCDTTVHLLELLALGQLLPPPLASLRELIPHLQPPEVVQLLRDCVWNYMRDNVPSPALFTRDSTGLMWRDASLAIPGPQYTDTLRFVIQRNMQKLGYLYPQLFPFVSDSA